MARPYQEESYNYPKALVSIQTTTIKATQTTKCEIDAVQMTSSWNQVLVWSCLQPVNKVMWFWWYRLTKAPKGTIHVIPISQSGSEINSGLMHVIERSHGISYCRNGINGASSGPQKLTYFSLEQYSKKLVTSSFILPSFSYLDFNYLVLVTLTYSYWY